ncbi:hypothetical protein HMPREF3036_00572 [Sutterella sp. KLE1602]|nr:hypothetical protein HMPREF3036_00572 [Sutterella sp. KLE1602]
MQDLAWPNSSKGRIENTVLFRPAPAPHCRPHVLHPKPRKPKTRLHSGEDEHSRSSASSVGAHKKVPLKGRPSLHPCCRKVGKPP